MNRYDYKFYAVCPSDGTLITYDLTIRSRSVIMAETIVSTCIFHEPIYHEKAADFISEKLGGKQRMKAVHQGVEITTTRAL